MSGYRYPGSRPFQDTPLDRKLFWGREHETNALLHLVLAEKMVVVFARSGLGKSSLINAGLLEPLRRRDYFPIVARINDPEHGPLHTLYRDIEEAFRKARLELCTVPGGRLESDYGLVCQGSLPPRGELSEHCCRRRIPLWLFWKELELWRGDVLLEPTLILDQFEELFTLQPPAQRDAFVEQLADLTRGRLPSTAPGKPEDGARHSGIDDEQLAGPDLKLLLSMREDWLGSLEELVPKIPGILNTRFRLEPLRREQARQAIVGPAAMADEDIAEAGFSYTDEAVDAILGFLCRHSVRGELVPTDEVAPSQLQLVCQHLEGLVRQPGHAASISLDDLGGAAGNVAEVLGAILEQYYDAQTWRAAGRLRRRAIRELCEDGLMIDGRRISLDRRAILSRYRLQDRELQRLTDAHLLRAVPRLDSVYYELSHDTLVQPILRSRAKRRRRERRRLAAAALVACLPLGLWGAHQWLEGTRKGLLLDVEAAQAELPTPTGMLRVVAAAERARGLALTAELPARVRYALSQAVEVAREAGRLNVEADSSFELRASALDADRGIAVDGDADGRLWLRGEAPSPPFDAHRGAVRHVALGPGGRVASAGADGRLVVWQPGAGALWEASRPGPGGLDWVGFLPGGELAGLGADRRLDVWRPDGTHRSSVDLAESLGRPAAVAFFGDGAAGRRWLLADVQDRLLVTDARGHPLALRQGGRGALAALAVHPRGHILASGSPDGSVRLWDERGAPLATPFSAHPGGVLAVAFDPAGERLASGGADGTVRLWSLAGQARGEPLRGHRDAVTALAWSAGGQWLASAGADWTVRLWRASGELDRELTGHAREVRALAFDAAGEHLASGSADGTVRIWPLRGGLPTILDEGPELENQVTALAFDPAGRRLAAGGSDGGLRLWLLGGDSVSPCTVGEHQGSVLAVAFAADGRLASGGRDGSVRIWNPANACDRRPGSREPGEPRRVLEGFKRYVHSVAFAADGTLAAGSYGGTVQLLRGDLLRAQPELFDVRQHHTTALAASDDGAWIASGSSDGSLRLWRWSPRRRELELRLRPFRADGAAIRAVAVSPDRRWIAAGSADGTVRLWNRRGEQVVSPLTGHRGPVAALAFATDGTSLASRADDGTLRRWDLEQPRTAGEPPTDPGPPAVATLFTHSTSLLTVTADGAARTWDAASRAAHPAEPLALPAGVRIVALAAAPRSATLAAAGDDGRVRLWDPQGAVLAEIPAGPAGSLRALALTADGDGETLAVARAEGDIRLWHLGEAIRPAAEPLPTPRGAADALAFTPGGDALLGGGADGILRRWDLTGGATAEPFAETGTAVTALAVSPDGTLLASAGPDGVVHFWDPTGQPVAHPLKTFQGPIRQLTFDPTGQHLLALAADGSFRLWQPRGDDLRVACRRLVAHPLLAELEALRDPGARRVRKACGTRNAAASP